MVRTRSRWLIISTASEVRGSSTDYRRRLLALMEEARALAPEERILVIVRDAESPWWASVLGELPEANVLSEPLDRGSATGVLLAFLRAFRRDHSAELVIVGFDAPPGSIRAATAAPQTERPRTLPPVWRATPAALLRMFRNAQPKLLSSLLQHVREEPVSKPGSLDGLYPFLPAVDLNRDVYAWRTPARAEAVAWAI